MDIEWRIEELQKELDELKQESQKQFSTKEKAQTAIAVFGTELLDIIFGQEQTND